MGEEETHKTNNMSVNQKYFYYFQTVMFNNSTNINIISHLKSLNINDLRWDMIIWFVDICGIAWPRYTELESFEQAQNVAGLNRLMGFQSSRSWELDLQRQYIYKQTV